MSLTPRPGLTFPEPLRRAPARRLLLAVCLSVAIPALASASGSAEHGPRLVLPGEQVVRPGEWLEVSWTAADSVLELELLVSVDGGRHYLECTPPMFDPRSGHLRWRVPDARGPELRLRIRYNRAGREIEGAPSRALGLAGSAPAGASPPLGLPAPPAAAADVASRGPRPQVPARTGALGAVGETEPRDPRHAPPPGGSVVLLTAAHGAMPVRAEAPARPPLDGSPGRIPLRT